MYYFIGIKGVGMSALAKIMDDLGYDVAGSDIDKYIFVQDDLLARNIPIYSFAKENIKPNYKVIIGHAFNEKNNVEVLEVIEREDIEYYYYNDFLGKLISEHTSVCVSGTHGKTTTTGMLYHVLKQHNTTMCLIGDGTGIGIKDAKYFAVEACEYREHFLHYYPDYAIINNIELDHVDYFNDLESYINSFSKFADNVKKKVIVYKDDVNFEKIKLNKPTLTFGRSEGCDVRAIDIVEDENGIQFKVLINNQIWGVFSLPFFGKHMLLNSLAVISVAYEEKMEANEVEKALKTFNGVKRRFNIEEIGDKVYIDDYAHHPTAITTTINAVRQKYPNKEIVAIFKPDRFSRIYHFADQFANSLDLADYVYLFPFPDNATKEEGINIDINYLKNKSKKAIVIDEENQGLTILAGHNNVVYLFMSSKDVYSVAKILKKM